eukprot:4158758-Prymnesium_polylepis.1
MRSEVRPEPQRCSHLTSRTDMCLSLSPTLTPSLAPNPHPNPVAAVRAHQVAWAVASRRCGRFFGLALDGADGAASAAEGGLGYEELRTFTTGVQ